MLESDCDLLASVINGVDASQVEELRKRYDHQPDSAFPVYVVPSEPSLNMLSVGNISRQLDARILSGDSQTFNRPVKHYKIAAMQVPDFLEHLEEGDLIITPSDRADIILACLMSYPSSNYPQIAGLLLTGKQNTATQVESLIAGLGDTPFTVLSVDHDTFTTAMLIKEVRSRIYSQDERKIATALGLMESSLNFDELRQRLANNHSERVTPLMFEYEQIQRAKANIQHIVLPEGDEERILRAAEILLLRNIVKITLLGDIEIIQQKINSLGLHLDDIIIIDPLKSELRELYAEAYFNLRKEKGVTYDMAYDIMPMLVILEP